MSKTFLLAAPLALAAGALLAGPASAAAWNAGPGNLRAEIAQLDRQIDTSRGISNSEARDLHRQVDRLQDRFRKDARGGFTRGEIERLQGRIASVRADIARQARDWNGHGERHGVSYGRR